MQEPVSGNILRNARFKNDNYSGLKSSIKNNLKDLSTQSARKAGMHELPSLKIKASNFTDRVRTIEQVSAVSNSAKMKLLEMRFSQSEKRNLALNDFNVLLAGKDFATEFTDPATGKKTYFIDPLKIRGGLEPVILPESIRKHTIKDNFSAKPPTSLKVADLQQLMGININGYFDADTFNSLNERYLQALLHDVPQFLAACEKLLVILVQKLGDTTHFGGYLKGLLSARAALTAAESGKRSDFDRLFAMMSAYLPEHICLRLKNRVLTVQKLQQLLSAGNNKIASLNYFIRSELRNLSVSDKIKLLEHYNSLFSAYAYEIDLEALTKVIVTFSDEVLPADRKQILVRTINYLIKNLKEKGNNEKLATLQFLYNRFKTPAP